MRRAIALSVTTLLAVAALLAAPLSPAAADTPWLWPVDAPRSVVRPFLAPATAYAAGHRGVDIRAPGGIVYAPEDGAVHFSGIVAGRPVLSVEHSGGFVSSYEPVASTLRAGDLVTRGQIIGTVLDGHCSTTCLHFGIRLDGLYVSPLNLLGGIPRSILLPTRELVG